MDVPPIVGTPAFPGATEPPRAAGAAAASASEPSTPPSPDFEQIARAVDAINKALPAASRSLEFSADPETRKMVVKVVDRETKQVIRQFPSVQALQLARSIDRMQGLLVRQEA